MFKSKKISLLIFFFILLIGVFLRFYKLTEIPPGMTIDEVSIGYNGFTILKSGKDQYGKFLPITHFRSVDDYKLPFYIYTVAFSEKFFGNNIFSVRFPAALFGSLTIIAVFLLAKQLFGKKIGLISSLLFAVSPWHSFHSHLGLETNAGLFFFVNTILFMYLSLKRQWFIVVGALFFALSIYSYHVFWLILPLILLAFIIIHKKFFVKMNRKILFLSLLLVVLSAMPFVLERNSGNASRFNQSLLSEKRISKITTKVSKGCNFMVQTCTFIKSSADITEQIANQYIGAYSLITLYGPSQFDQVNVVANRGLFYFFELLLFILGIIVIYKKRDKNLSFLISWLFIYPLPLALTGNISAARMYGLLPLPQIIEAVGLYFIMRKNIILMLGFLFIIILSVFRFISDLWFVYPTIYSRYTGYGPIAIVDYINNHKGYKFYVEEPLFDKLYFLYFYKVLPNQQPKIKDEKGVLVIDNKKVYIVERGYLPPNKDQNILISFPQDIPNDYRKIGEINLKDNSMYAVLSSPK